MVVESVRFVAKPVPNYKGAPDAGTSRAGAAAQIEARQPVPNYTVIPGLAPPSQGISVPNYEDRRLASRPVPNYKGAMERLHDHTHGEEKAGSDQP